MKQKLEELVLEAVAVLKNDGILDSGLTPNIIIEHTRDPQHGDFASNLALVLAKPAKANPRQLAEKIVAAMPQDDAVIRVEIAGPGFINFFMNPAAQYRIIETIHDQGHGFGLSRVGAGQKVQVEFVSANPTGPLHVGHGRGAAYGSVVADLLEAVGFDVYREYYVNDAGRQMDILATSIWLRYLEECGEVL
ncbi:MAG: arginine--tRNA ligase domain-containing protein, partial [Gammaproteobacteria bacterium]